MGIEAKLEKIRLLEEITAKLRAEVEVETPKKWQPKGGRFAIYSNGDVEAPAFVKPERRDFGATRETREQATKDAKRMRQFSRLLCWMIEQGWDDELVFFNDANGDVSLCFLNSDKISRELMYGIANGVIEL